MEISTGWLAPRIVEGAADAVLFTDREGAIRLWRAGEREADIPEAVEVEVEAAPGRGRSAARCATVPA